MKRKQLLLLVMLLCGSSLTKAQFFASGQEPAGMKWDYLKSKHFKIIFTEDYSIQAYYLSSLLEKNYSFFSDEFHIEPHFTHVVLHNRTAVSNGFSVLSPLRMEMGAVAPQTIYSQPWLDQLAIHEFRHSLQIQTFRRGFARYFHWLFGDVATSSAMALLPFWYIEGEAVWTETNYSRAGRGRDAEFLMRMRAMAVENSDFSVSKVVLGSYKDNVPNYYNVGYHLYNYGRKKYGDSLWGNVIERMAKTPYRPFPFTSGIKKYSGKNFRDFCKDAINEIVMDARRNTAFVEYQPINPVKDDFADYGFVFPVTGDEFVAFKKSYSDISSIVKFDKNGEEKTLHYPGYVFDGKISYANNKIVWSELVYDARWAQKDDAVINLLDLNTGKVRKLTFLNEKYFSPALSPNAEFVAAVKTDDAKAYYLKILSVKTGAEVYSKKYGWDELVITPQWDRKGERVVFVLLSDKGKQINMLDVATQTITTLRKAETHNIKYPCLDADRLFFVAPYNGKNNLYVSHLDKKDLYKITDAKYGVNFPKITGNQIFFSDYSTKGYSATHIVNDSSKWLKIEENSIVKPFNINTDRVEALESFRFEWDSTIEKRKYIKGKNLINFHSLTPFAMHNDLSFEEYLGVSVHSQNMLSSMFVSGGYFYRDDLKADNFYLDIAYKALGPVFDFNINYGTGRLAYFSSSYTNVTFKELNTKFSIKFPVNINSGNYYRKITPEVEFGYTDTKMYSERNRLFIDQKILVTGLKLSIYNLRRKSKRDIFPKFGQVVEFSYLGGSGLSEEWISNIKFGNDLSVEGQFYFPGIMKNHSLWFYCGYQRNDNMIGWDEISYSRGIDYFIRDEVLSGKANYTFPVLYPDLQLGCIAYLKRITANLFYDKMKYWEDHPSSEDGWEYHQTTGFEIKGEIHLFRHIIPAIVGVRNTYKIDTQDFYSEIMLNFNLNY
ncbi:MAG: hypothetical protein U9R32_04590 [Bacteroidota bacterium]|nr:hypothetical protein [Bacteroidota bacterium]